MTVELDAVLKALAAHLSANIDQKLTVALATGIVNLLNQEFTKQEEPKQE